ncbi:DJ-1/PfpI family protein [Flagellimonas meishanensis]|uniref:DJ-1/PfpI family protein n=1 Tax=Flagellimonas meishanensis TaxID=2873264 RepID=UPI001CA7583B|nr:DJ-1/PfpI family protein [[Muricauda] meishanensis]
MRNYFLLAVALVFSFSTNAQDALANLTPKYSVQYICPPCGCPQDGNHFDAPGICSDCNMAYNTQLKGLEDKPRIPSPRRTAAIVLFNGADIMDVTGPMSVFEHAGFNVVTVAKDGEPKRIGMHMQLVPDHTFQSLPDVDVIMVPGGGPAESNQDMDIVNWLRERDSRTDTMFSVCSGAFFLGLAGILDNNEATTFASLIPNLRTQFPKAKVLDNVKYANNGHVVTSSGLSSGIDASFEVVAKYYGVGIAQDIANRMEYPWKRKNDYARSQLADNFIATTGNLVRQFATKYHHSEGNMNAWEYRYILWKGTDIDKFMDLMAEELQKLPNFELNAKREKELSGTYTHPVVGKGEVFLELVEKEGAHEVSLSAKRLDNYSIQ